MLPLIYPGISSLTAHVTGLQDQIDGLGSVSQVGGERQDAIDHILAGISALSHEVADASDYVPSYDQRSYAQVSPLPSPISYDAR